RPGRVLDAHAARGGVPVVRRAHASPRGAAWSPPSLSHAAPAASLVYRMRWRDGGPARKGAADAEARSDARSHDALGPVAEVQRRQREEVVGHLVQYRRIAQ